MKQILSSLLFASLFVAGCKKDNATSTIILPPPSHNGSDVIAFMANKKVIILSGPLTYISPGVSYRLYGDSTVYISASSTANPNYSISIRCNINYGNILGTYPIVSSPYPLSAEFDDFSSGTVATGSNQFKVDSTHTGNITITYYDGTILAGTFSFDAVNADDSVIHITNGEFDISK
jgi:hypothetical protein